MALKTPMRPIRQSYAASGSVLSIPYPMMFPSIHYHKIFLQRQTKRIKYKDKITYHISKNFIFLSERQKNISNERENQIGPEGQV